MLRKRARSEPFDCAQGKQYKEKREAQDVILSFPLVFLATGYWLLATGYWLLATGY